MTIRKRILKSNTLIVLLSLFTLLAIGGTIILMFEDTYVKTLTQDARLQENAFNVQTLLNEFQLTNEITTKTDFVKLDNMLTKYNYQLYVSEGNSKVYSNILHQQIETVEIMNSEIVYTDKPSLYAWENKTIVTRKVINGTNSFDLLAIHSEDTEGIYRLKRATFEQLILSFAIVGVGSILVIVFISQFFTKKLVNKMMLPIHKLKEGAGRIEQGKLDEPIKYVGEVEFEMVCKSFNKMQESLKAGMEKNAAYEKARTDMVSGISHDLRTPLTSVKGYIKGVKDGIANTPEKQEKYLDIAYKKACDMEILLQKLFYFSNLETGNMPLYPIKINFIKFLEEFIKENEEYYVENNLEVSLSFQKENHFVKIDKEQMSRVIANIIENSIKYKNEEHVKVSIEVSESDNTVILTITDNGLGVPEEKLPHLFEQFYRVDEARNSKNKGNGLGLYISKYIVEQHGGKISAINNSGLRIQIVLPKNEE